MTKIGFIGFGNIAQAMVKGYLLKDRALADSIYASARNYSKLVDNCHHFGIHACQSNEEVVKQCDVIMLCVKPYMAESVLAPLKELLENKMLVSVLAGYPYDKFDGLLPESCHHISTNPNIPIACGQGIVIAEDKHNFTDDQLALFNDIMQPLGRVIYVETKNFSVGCTLAGCGPAFAAMVVESLADAGVKYGLTRTQAYEISEQMIIGSGQYLLDTGLHPGQLKDSVCSPGGTTIKGVTALEKEGLRNAVISAFDAILDK